MADSASPARDPHAILDHESRVKKAEKIVAQLRFERRLEGLRVLDIGCGGGMIAHQLSRAVGATGGVWGVDLVDQRTIREGYNFKLVDGTSLPFGAQSFDIVVTNHCIEHVGGRAAQLHHLAEIHRVLADDGIGYLAVPNRWVIVEPHFRLPFLSWLPRSLRSPYVRATGRGERYDCDMPRPAELERLFEAAGFRFREVTIDAMRLLLTIEPPGLLKRLIFNAPSALLRPLRGLFPTKMYVLGKLEKQGG